MLYEVVYEIIDSGDHLATLTTYLEASDVGSAITRAKVLGELVDIVILGKISKVTVGHEFVPSWSIKTSPLEGSLISQIARFMFSDSSVTEFEKISLPSFDPSLVDPSTLLITSSADVVAFMQEIMDNNFTTRFGTDIDGSQIEYFVEGGE